MKCQIPVSVARFIPTLSSFDLAMYSLCLYFANRAQVLIKVLGHLSHNFLQDQLMVVSLPIVSETHMKCKVKYYLSDSQNPLHANFKVLCGIINT